MVHPRNSADDSQIYCRRQPLTPASHRDRLLQDEATGETKIGCSYEHLCRDLKPGNRVLIADGTICIEVKDILSDTELKGTVLNDRF